MKFRVNVPAVCVSNINDNMRTCFRMNLVETHLWQNDNWKDQYVGVVPRGTSGSKVELIFHITCVLLLHVLCKSFVMKMLCSNYKTILPISIV